MESWGGEISAHSEGIDLGSVFSFSMQMEHLDEPEEERKDIPIVISEQFVEQNTDSFRADETEALT